MGSSAEALRLRCRAALTDLSAPGDEGARLEAAFHAIREVQDAGVLDDDAQGISLAVLLRLAAVEEADRRWPFAEIGRTLAARGEHSYLTNQLPRVRTDADRRELLEQHRIWGRAAEAKAARKPITVAPRGPRTRRRIGLLSADLRMHVVLAFAEPLIQYAGENGVELYCYSAQPGEPDAAQQHVARHVAAFRHLPGAVAHELAQAIAADAPDVLIDIGGSTGFNRVEAMAHRLAPVQLSWMGYPHSCGLSTIDYMVLDPHLAPTDTSLLIERPLLMPRSSIALSPGFLSREAPLAAELPQERKGVFTFGSAGSTYKYSAASLRAWARVLASVPNSRFLFVRPEGGSEIFRRNVAEHFARMGVADDRLDFAVVRHRHRPLLSEIDISLDTFPLTGGTTTIEALWMGAPVVSLRGPAVYERVSHAILTNVGLSDLSVETEDAFVARAVELAGDQVRRRRWRAEGRDAMTAALGDAQGFAAEFYAMLARF